MAFDAVVREVDTELELRLQELTQRYENVDPKELIKVVDAVIQTSEGDFSGASLKLYHEIEELSDYIRVARSEIAALRPDEIMAEHLPKAGEELEAIVGATEQATHGILAAVEDIEAIAETLSPEQADKVTDAVTRIYESCSFQDITGQRISKVVVALQHIEHKVHGLLATFGQDDMASLASAATNEAAPTTPARIGKEDRPDEHLLNGPQMPDQAISQDDIDALLASFD